MSHGEQAQPLSITAGELAALLGGTLEGPPDLRLTGIAPIESGGPGEVTFIRAASFARHWAESRCSAALVTESLEIPGHDPAARALIRVPDADAAFAAVLAQIDPGHHLPPRGVHPSAVVDPAASVHPDAAVGPGCTIGPGSSVGPGSALIAGVHIGQGVTVGASCVLHPGVVIGDRCTIGDRCLIHPNAVVGADGFGYIPPTDDRPAIKIPQIGSVIIGNDCEIGAGSAVDRAKFGQTRIGDRVKIDNLVHIGHNCVIGDDCILCGRATLGGSVTMGSRVMLGGAVTVADQVSVGDNARIAGGAIVMDAIPPGETVAGIPAMPARTALANYAAFGRLAEFMRKAEKSLTKLTRAHDEQKPVSADSTEPS